MASTTQLNTPYPVLWVVLIISLALVTYLLPDLGAVLIYDRSAIFAGDIWRLLTGHLVHFTPDHLIYDVSSVAITTWIIESRGHRHLVLLGITSALSISLVMLALLPDMMFYGGLSGIAMANAVYLALCGFKDTAPWPKISMGILFACLIKLVLDVVNINFVQVDIHNNMFTPVPLSHFIGAITGLVIYLWSLR